MLLVPSSVISSGACLAKSRIQFHLCQEQQAMHEHESDRSSWSNLRVARQAAASTSHVRVSKRYSITFYELIGLISFGETGK